MKNKNSKVEICETSIQKLTKSKSHRRRRRGISCVFVRSFAAAANSEQSSAATHQKGHSHGTFGITFICKNLLCTYLLYINELHHFSIVNK